MTAEVKKIGDWEKVKPLGSGGFGEVALWKNCSTGHQVAIKKCRPPIKGSCPIEDEKKLFIRWNRELQYMNSCATDYIVKGYPELSPPEFLTKLNQSCPKELPVLAMEFCSGGDLRAQLTAFENRTGLKEIEVKNILFCLRNAVQYLHSHDITHRDIKPENIVIKNVSGRNVYKLTDMGYARNIDANTIQASLVGTRDYFAPEIITEFTYKNTVDYWSVGVIAFEIICGIRPFIPHQQLHTCIIQIGRKTNKHIAITEVPEGGDYRMHEHLFSENKCSQVFQKLIEKWLCLTLDCNNKGKMRGYIMNDPPQDFMTSTTSPPPLKILKFYDMLDEILKTKILTIFNISTYEHISLIIDGSMTFDELFSGISSETKIPEKDLCLWFPNNHKFFEIQKGLKRAMRGEDFYMDNFDSTDQPMVYVMNMQSGKEFCPPESNVDETIKYFFTVCPQEAIKKHFLNEFVLKSLHLIRTEQRQYFTLLGGLKCFAEQKSDELNKYPGVIPALKKNILKCFGMIEQFLNFVKCGELFMSNQINGMKDIFDLYKEKIRGLQSEFIRFDEQVVDKLEIRLASCNRRIKQRLENKFLSEIYDNLLGLKDFENFLLNKKSTVLDVQKRVTKFVQSTLHKRHKLLNSPELKSVQIDVIEIHKECHTFKTAIPKALQMFEMVKKQLDSLTDAFMKDYTLLVQGSYTGSAMQIDQISIPFNSLTVRDSEADSLISTTRSLLEQMETTFNTDVEMIES